MTLTFLSVSLKMGPRQKIPLLAVVCLGVLVIIAAAIRLARVLAVDRGGDYPCKYYCA